MSSDSDPYKLPKLTTLSTEELQTLVKTYYKKWKFEYNYSQILSKLATILFPDSLNYIKVNRAENILEHNDISLKEYIDRQMEEKKINNSYDLHGIIKKLNQSLAECQDKMKQLIETNTMLTLELSQIKTKTNQTINNLQQELSLIKNNDPFEKRKNLIEKLLSNRKRIPFKEVDMKNKHNSILNRLFSSEYMSSSIDSRTELYKEQKDIELTLIDNYISLLKDSYDSITASNKIDSNIIETDITPILLSIQECRINLSYVVQEQEFIALLQEHIKDLDEILDIFRSKIIDDTATISLMLTPYESGLINYINNSDNNNYLSSYVRNIDLQKYILSHNIVSNKLDIFEHIPEINYYHLFCNIEDIVKSIFIVSKPTNNVIYIPTNNNPGADHNNFYTFDQVINTKDKDGKQYVQRVWKSDSRLIGLSRNFAEKFRKLGIKVFKQFYYDCFGHNRYIDGFEDILDNKNIQRWKQMKNLYENIKICSDEYLIGEIIRIVIRKEASYYPNYDIDSVMLNKDYANTINEYRQIISRWKNGLPGNIDEQSDVYLFDMFDNYNDWNYEKSRALYYKRWKEFLSTYPYTIDYLSI